MPGQSSNIDNDPFSSLRMLGTVLFLVFLVEFGIMFVVLPNLIPKDTAEHLEALADATLLTLGLVPLLWIVIVRPLQEAAVGERSRALSVISTAADGIITMDRHAHIQSINPAVTKILGWTSEELAGESITRIFADEIADQYGSLIDSAEPAIRGEDQLRASSEIDITGISNTGDKISLTVSLSSFEVGGQRFLTTIVHDLTERLRAEAEIAARARQQAEVAELGQRALAGVPLQELLHDVARSVQQTLEIDGCLVLEADRGATLSVAACAGDAVQPICEQQYNLSPEMDQTWMPAQLVTFDLSSDAPSLTPLGIDLRQAGLASVTTAMIEKPDGKFGALLACRLHADDPGRDARDFLLSAANVIGSALQRQRAERELREKETMRAEQMASIAQVATGVAHEIRNPLTSVKMICQTLSEELQADSAAARDCEVMVEEILRMEQSLNVFLDYARPTRPEFNNVDLAELIDRTARLIKGRADRQQVQLQIESDKPGLALMVFADGGKLQQLLLNLGLNSLAMMPTGGKLTFSTEWNGSCICVAVSDTGPGVPDENRQRIFEPFFTTRETGVGLGLVISRRIAEEHHGTLELKPSSEGAVFALTIPVTSTTNRQQSESPQDD